MMKPLLVAFAVLACALPAQAHRTPKHCKTNHQVVVAQHHPKRCRTHHPKKVCHHKPNRTPSAHCPA